MSIKKLFSISVTLFSLAVGSLNATDFEWAGGSGLWSTAGNWIPAGGPPNGSGDSAKFSSSSGIGTPTI